jgi:hypothetical protein
MTTFAYDGAYALPGQRTQIETKENQFWYGRREDQLYFPVVIGGASRDVGNTSYTQILRSGLLLGMVTSTKKLKEWNPTGTDGSERLFGVLDLPLNMQRLGSNQDRYLGHVLVRGLIKPEALIVPGETTYGISGEEYEHVIRYQMQQRGIMLTDSTYTLARPNIFPWADIVAKTADYTITEADNNTLFTNRGAAGAVVLTLPVTAKKGLRYGLHVVAGQNLKFTSGTADTMISFNDAAADSVGFETASELIGGHLEVIGDGTSWIVVASAFGLGATAQTVTTAT